MHTPHPPSRSAGANLPSARLLVMLALVPFISLALGEMRAPLSMSVGDQAQYLVYARRPGVRLLFCVMASYVGATLIMPWAVGRFLRPALPLLWFVTLLGLRAMLEWVRVPPRHALATTLAAALCVPVLAVVLAEARSLRITHAIVGSTGTDRWADEPLGAMIGAHPGSFEKVFANEQFAVYRLLSAPVSHETATSRPAETAP